MKRPSLLVIFLSVFIDLIGFGIVMPQLPIYAKQFGSPGYLIGMIMASFSVMQFLFAPLWGRLSDRIGRRPVILVSNAGSALAYAMFAIASSKGGQGALLMILISRIFAGICGANLSVASAYIADVTPVEKRSRGMALIGVAFGLGFILGPAISSFSARYWGLPGPGWVASAICAANVLFAIFVLQESRRPDSESAVKRARFNQWAHTLGQPTVGFVIILYFLAIFCFGAFETTFGLLVEPLGYDEKNVGYLIAFCGFVTALVQGVVGRLVKMFGERQVIPASLVVAGVGLLMLPFAHSRLAILVGLAVLAIGSGINRAPTLGLLSILTPPNEQGAMQGVAQSAGSLARILAPIFAASIFDLSHGAPYLICAAIAVLAGLIAWVKLCRGPVVSGA
jgi:DHA1 family tetracycline resistance protein-like MFS transporter